jgi:hypothetical protein
MKPFDKDRTDEQLHKYIHLKTKNKIGFVDTNVGGDLNVMKNLTTDTLKANKIGYDLSGLDASGYAQFLDLSTNNLIVSGDAVITGTLEINNILRKTMTEIDITGDLDLSNKLDVSGLFTTHGGININGTSLGNKINNVEIGYDLSGKGAFTDLSCSFLNAGSIDLSSLNSCTIGLNIPSSGNFTDINTDTLTVGNGVSNAIIKPNGNHDIQLRNNGTQYGLISINHGLNNNIEITPSGIGSVVISKTLINSGNIKNVDLSDSNIFSGINNTFDVSKSTVILSYDQQTDILKKGTLNNDSDIDFQDYDIRAKTVTADSLPKDRVVYTDTSGLLATETGFEYDPINNELKVQNLSSFTLTGSSNLNSQILTNVNIDSGTIDNTTIKTSNITVGNSKTIDVQYGNFVTSTLQDLDSFHRAVQNNDQDLDIQAYTLRAHKLVADSLPTNRVVFTGSDGLLQTYDNLQYDLSAAKLTVGRLSSFECTGLVDFKDQSANNAKINSSTIENSDISTTNINVGQNKTLDVSNGTFVTSSSQNVNILQSGSQFNDSDIDIQNYDLRASTLTADSLTTGQVVYTGDNGRLTAEPGFEYNTTANTLTVNNLTSTGLFSLSQTVNTVTAVSGGSQINIAYTKTALITSASFATFTLPDSAEGHVIIIFYQTKNGAAGAAITPSNLHNGSTVTLTNVGDNITLLFTNNKWLIIASFGNVNVV